MHGLGINPADGSLFIATHTGLFRTPAGERRAERVGKSAQDTMGFTVAGPDRFLGSGHPDGRDELPPFLGLIESRDAGRTWKPVSLLGKADFHVLEAAGDHVYGFGSDWESREARFLVSTDGGRRWKRRAPPEPLFSLALNPEDPERLLASGELGIHESSDGGRTWRQRSDQSGLLAWPAPDTLVLVDGRGEVKVSSDARVWNVVGNVEGPPAAFEAERDGLYVALHDGTVKRSSDGGRTWKVRSAP